MKQILVLVLVVSQVRCEVNWDAEWTSWKDEFNKEYSSEKEEVYRISIWKQNYLMVMKHNEEFAAGNQTYTMKTNHLSDMTTDEVNSKLNGLRRDDFLDQDPTKFFTVPEDFKAPSEIDWRKKGYVTPVKNQGNCGSCWAFSAVGALEAQMKNKTGRLVRLSEQNLVDCSKNGNHGCKGGLMTRAFEYIINNRGIDSERFYPYKGKDGRCRYSCRGRAGYMTGYWTIPRRNEKKLKCAVARIGPVSVAINAGLSSFHHYHKGVYNDRKCDSRLVNHAVLVVGYGTEKKRGYWLIKNSWGTKWGNRGYIQLARNKQMCGIPTYAAVPIV